jgi:hypothetical protein
MFELMETSMIFLTHHAQTARIGPRSKAQMKRDEEADVFPRAVRVGGQLLRTDVEIESWQRWKLAQRDGTTTIQKWSQWWADRTRQANLETEAA